MVRREYANFAALRAAHLEGRDFKRICKLRPKAGVAVIAPHGGRIEAYTSAIAAEIAARDLSLYSFRSRVPTAKANLHITSHNFDDPKCVGLVKKHRWVVAVHGCKVKGSRVLLGGLDKSLVRRLAEKLESVGILVQTTGHKFGGTDRMNICNRGASGQGVQFELSMRLRKGKQRQEFVRAVREVLLGLQQEA